jgi:long-subunit fatty acid transport protein
MKKNYVLLLLTLTGAITTLGQNNQEKSEFNPSGSPFAKIYTNLHTQVSESRNETGFEITRAYFGYEYEFSRHFSAKINLDVGDPELGKFQHTAFLKNAYMKFNYNNLTTCFGMISTIQFKLQEKIWGHRYILKSFQDEYKFGSSADIGISIAYKLHDMVSVDAILMNGEGYKSVQLDSTYRAGAGITITPVKGLTLRGYFDYEKKEEPFMNVATFIGYSKDAIAAGVEFIIENNNKYEKDHNLTGYSAYASYQLKKKLEFFGRYDYLTSNTLSGETDPWNISKNGQLFMAGVEYAPVKGIKIAPNYKGWMPSADGSSLISWIYLSAEISF